MTEISYKKLAAKRLAVLPEEFAYYRETSDQVIVTTLDQVEHTFTKMELLNPAKKTEKPSAEPAPSETKEVAEKGSFRSKKPSAAAGQTNQVVKSVAKKQ